MQKVPQWYGETVGFWDGDTLVSWTANVQGWTQHTLFEFSNKMETVETFKPMYDAQHHFIGIDHEAVWYDPDALVQPLRVNDRFLRRAVAGDPDCALYVHRVPVEHQERQRPAGAAHAKAIRISSTTTAAPGRRTGRNGSKRAGRSPMIAACRATYSTS